MNQRKVAFEIIYKTISDKAYTNLLMREKLKELEPIQRPFVTNLVNGVLKEYDYLVFQFVEHLKNSTYLRNKIIIAMALYERYYLSSDAYYVNNEYVELANKHDKPFVNAILRKEYEFKKGPEHINESLPEWIYKLLKSQYDEESFTSILKNYKRIPTVYYRLNHNKCKYTDLKDINIINEDIFTSNKSLVNSEEFKKGYFYIEDINSSSLTKHLDLKEDDVLLDVCCAPGSKLFNCLDIIKPNNAYSNELHEHRLELIRERAKLLGFDGVHYLNYDGRILSDVLDEKFDKILLDVPCSGLGTLGRKPDLKYHLSPSSLDELQVIQKGLLNNTSKLLKTNGEILYSTCTLNKKENGKQVLAFLKEHDEFSLKEEDTIINDLGDCFYYAVLKKEDK